MLRMAFLLVLLAASCSFARPAPVREQPWWLPQAPNKNFLRTIAGVIYVPPGKLRDYTEQPLSIHAAALLEHEQLHARRQHEQWMVLWHIYYLTNPSFRWREERAGYAAQLRYLAQRGSAIRNLRTWFVEKATDPYYAGMTTAEEAGAWFDHFLLDEGL